ncbi:MAG: hypothetical protein ACK4E3_10565 [Brevundimonas sp.]|uniref:hypothetical protein n=1 Tax=Brevundimonas sp. TaxID=1871086 RepID=UPI00391A9D3D
MRVSAPAITPDSAAVASNAVARRLPDLDIWMRERGLTDGEGARLFGCSRAMVNAMRRPFGHPARKEPSPALRARIVIVTDGKVRPESHVPTVAEIMQGVQ